VAKDIREVGNKLWKEGKSDGAVDKWQSTFFLFPFSTMYLIHMGVLTEAIRYLDHHPDYSAYLEGKTPLSGDPENPLDEEDAKRRRGFQELLSALLLNSALGAIKLAGPIHLRTAVSLTNRAVGIALSDADRGKRSGSVRR